MVEQTTVDRAHALGRRLREVRTLTEALAAPLSPEDQTVQSMPDVSPTKWHRAHTSWFFETFLLQPSLPDYVAFHPAFGYLFNSYYEAVGSRHPRAARGVISRPGVAEIGRYRSHVDEAMGRLLEKAYEEVLDLVELGIHHEQQHQELLLMDAKHVLSCNPLQPPYCAASEPARLGALEKQGWIEHPGGIAEIGTSDADFSFDNERPRHRSQLVPFALSDRAVTCGEWIEFLADGGYRRPELWLSDGWATVQQEGWDSPLYWTSGEPEAWEDPVRAGDDSSEWSVFTLMGRRAVVPSEPVCHVSYYEADAFARWAGARLPTEAEWEAVASPRWSPPPRRAEASPGPTDWHRLLHPSPADGPPIFFRNVWEWTASAYSAYPGFRAAAGAVGEYNGKFMVNQHVLRGGSCATPEGHIRPTYRNFFPPGARWAFSGLRLARDL